MADSSNVHTDEYVLPFQIEQEFITKYIVLNFVVRHISFVSNHEKVITIPKEKLQLVSLNTHIPSYIISKVVKGFLINVLLFRDHMNDYKLSWRHEIPIQIEKVSTFLERLYNMAPVFDFIRAKKNLEILYRLLELNCYWPCLTTQLALVIFVTDRNDTGNSEFITQKNLRAMCASSAYAFHRARNKLGINNSGRVVLKEP
ncbi:MAG: hypothetical protein ACFE85_10890 [Candidatus Hodarchaeota archaeon]